jgi:hypothetical protein
LVVAAPTLVHLLLGGLVHLLLGKAFLQGCSLVVGRPDPRFL